jgi:hypothetical protein
MAVNYESIRKRLELLRSATVKPDVFGWGAHGFKANPPVTESRLHEFESRRGVQLPEDYRGFLLNVGNGGAGPHYGLFALGEMAENVSPLLNGILTGSMKHWKNFENSNLNRASQISLASYISSSSCDTSPLSRSEACSED